MLPSRRQRLIARKAPATTAGRVVVSADSQEAATKPGDKYRSIQRPDVYRALRRKRGMSKEAAARISNAAAPGHTVKASPTRTLDAGHTSVAVMLLPSTATVQSLATLPGVTEDPATLHLTLCYLGSVDEVPLMLNKERIVNALLQWAALHNGALPGVINGVGRFYSTEDDGTNAVYVSPDLAALPALRQSLIQWVEQAGLDYAQDHGFTPHVTVAYVPADDPTPPIRVNVPACFDRLLLAWGDEQYETPLVEPKFSTIDYITDSDSAIPAMPYAAKAPNYGARAGQTISGALSRANDGQFTNSGSGTTSDAPAADKPAPKKGKRPKKTEGEREAEREAKRNARLAERAAARDAAYRKLNIAPDGQAALEGLRKGAAVDAAAIARHGLEDAGLVERDSDGKYRLTASGRATVNAASRGDTGRAGDTIAGARDRLRARRERVQERERKKRERDTKRVEQAAGKAQTASERAAFAKMGSGGGGGGGGGGSAAGGGGGDKLWSRGEDGKRVPPKGAAQQALRNFNKRDADVKKKKSDAIKADAEASTARRAGDKALADRYAARATQLRQEANKLESHDRNMADLRRIEAAGYRISGDSKRIVPLKRTQAPRPEGRSTGKAFTVFKDARGQWRWIGLTSNGYEDRDAEYVSVKALSADVARADSDGRHGPLRWWHMGNPDPTNVEAPWGPGVDLGWCDFNAMSGPFLVESGTFVSEKVARAIAPVVDQLGLSPGFFHPRHEPIAGVFHTIRRFERSLAPRAAVSNRFTTFSTITKERRMDAAKLKELAEMSGLDDTAIASLITGAVETRQKEASAEGVRLKTQDAPAIYLAPDGTPGFIQNGTFVTLKAARPAEDTPPAAMAPSGKAAVEEDVEVVEEEGDEDEGPLLLDADLDAIAERVFAKISPLLDIEKKMRTYADEVKSHFSGMATKTASTDAAVSDHEARLKAAEVTLAQAQAAVAELRGDAPAIVQRGGFAASTDPATALHAQIGQMMTGKARENGTPPQGKAAETLEWFVRGLTTGNPDGAAPQTPPNI